MKRGMAGFILSVLILAGCGAEQGGEPAQDAPVYTSAVSAEDCFLCGGAEESFDWGQNNVGLISLHTFEVMPIEINRYDPYGVLVEENTGCLRSHGFQSGEGGFCAHIYEDADRSRASGSITFCGDEILDPEKTAAFLCQDCLNAVLSETYGTKTGVGVINFATGEIQPLRTRLAGFDLRDYYIHLYWREPEEPEASLKAEILVFYCPPRYAEESF